MVIVKREEKGGGACSARRGVNVGRHVRGRRAKAVSAPRSVVYSYALEGRFASIYRFFLRAKSVGAPFRVSGVKLERKKSKDVVGVALTAFFDVEIPLFENES